MTKKMNSNKPELAILNDVFVTVRRVVDLKLRDWKFDKVLLVKNYLKESLLPIFCSIIHGKRSCERFDSEFILCV